jgi:hypothetical protein
VETVTLWRRWAERSELADASGWREGRPRQQPIFYPVLNEDHAMSLVFDFHPDAEAEFDADVLCYEGCEPGLWRRFRSQGGAAVDAAVDDPEAWVVWPG